MTGRACGIGVIGAGSISAAYLKNLRTFPDLEVRVVADLVPQVAASRAAEFGIAEHGTPEVALDHPDVDIIVNLTTPAAHVEVAAAAVRAGKHVWSEKPFATERASGLALLKEAATAGVRLGCAPDTFLGAGLQTARRVIERGDIGVPLTAQTVMQYAGPDRWHPNPAFLFQKGAGPLFDMGPYYLTALVQVLGSARRVVAVGSRSQDVRCVNAGPRAGEVFEVEVPTHVSAIVQFEGGAASTSVFSFQSPYGRAGYFELSGSEATLLIPDPNRFDGELRIRSATGTEWTVLPTTGPANGRGMGVLDMARAIRGGEPHRATGELAYHVLDIMAAINDSIESDMHYVDVTSSAPSSAPLPEDWAPENATLDGVAA
jgi:predicted dehydrogenase